MTPDPLATFLQLQIAATTRRLLVAYSGGLDSQALLHSLVQSRLRQSAPADAIAIEAVHVNHGLSPHADHWQEFCVAQCRSLNIPLWIMKVNASPAAGESPEAAARASRYHALHSIMREGDCLLTAHHQDDQAETLLLQLLRGAGPKGLAAMPVSAPFAAGWHARPLLNVSRDALRDYALQQRLQWIEDESNFDTGFDRNFIRHDIMPALTARFPAAAATLSRSAALCAEAADLLAEHSDSLLLKVSHADESLSISGLQALGEVRARQVLHHWIHRRGLPLPNAAHLQHIWHDVVSSAPDAEPLVAWQGTEARRYRDRLYVRVPDAAFDAGRSYAVSPAQPLHIVNLGVIELQPVSATTPVSASGYAIAPEYLRGKSLTVRFRQGGETLQPAGRQGHHALKKLFQEAGVPPWQRDRIPLLYADDELIAVAGYWVTREVVADDNEPGLVLMWSKKELTG